MSQKAYVLIKSGKGQADTVTTELSHKKGILKADHVFGQYDAVVLIEAANLEGLATIVRNEIAQAEHVISTETLVLSPSTKSGQKIQK